MIYENGSEEIIMSKQEAQESVKEMGSMMGFFEGICEKCGNKRMNCSEECVNSHIKEEM